MSNISLPTPATPLTSSQLWELTLGDLTKKQQAKVDDIKRWLRRKRFRLARLLSGREVWSAWTAEEVAELERSAALHLRHNRVFQHALRICGKLLTRAAELLGCPLFVPRIPVLPRRPRNLFHQDFVSAKRRVRKWRELLDEWVEASQRKKHSDIPSVVLSAVLYGGLLHPSTLVALVETLAASPDALGLVDGQLQINLLLAKNGQADMEKRRWLPDPLTAALLARLPEQAFRQLLQGQTGGEDGASPVVSRKLIKRILWREVAGALRTSTNLARGDRPPNLNKLMTTAVLAYSTELPPVLLAYAARRIVSHSLKPQVTQRLAGIRSSNGDSTDPFALSSQMAHQERAPPSSSRRSGSEAGADVEPPWLRALRAALRAPTKEEARTLLNKLQSQGSVYSSAGQRMIEFAEFLLTGATTIHSTKLSTARIYASSVAVHFGCLLDGQDPKGMTISELEVLYTLIFENLDLNQSSGVRKAVCRHLRRFHEFLMTRYSVGALQDRDLLGTRGGLVPVDANIFSLDEFQEILRQIDRLRVHPKLRRAAKLITILGFRCGLRQMEVLMLQLADLHLRGPGTLLVRVSEFRDLKTPAATRSLPLDSLLTEEELEMLREWKKERVANRIESEPPFVFSIPELSADVLSERLLFPLIHQAMREVTGDQSVRFHHLRHSFGTWTLARLLLADLPTTPPSFSYLPATTDWLKTARDFRTKLYEHGHVTRKHGFAVAALLGHSSPQVSLEHYIHCLDWILPAYLAGTPTLAPSQRQLVLASGHSSSTAYSWLQRGGPAYLVQQLYPSLAPPAMRAVTRELKPDASAAIDRIQAAWDFLYLHQTTGTPVGQLQADFEFTIAELEGMLARACQLRDLRSGRRRGPRHRMIVWLSNRGLSHQPLSDERRLCCPIKSHLQADQNVMNVLAPKLAVFLKQQPELGEKIIGEYVRSIWLEENFRIFEHPNAPEDTQEYLAFLDQLGIRRDQTRFVSFDKSQRSRWRSLWREALHLSPRYPIQVWNYPNARQRASAKWIGIEPQFQNSDSERKIMNNETGSSGFRFLLVMTDILLHGQKAAAQSSVLINPFSLG